MLTGKFAISLHILTLLAKHGDEFLSSDYIAGSLNVNRVMVRREIGNLIKNKVIESREGKYGGARLAKPASGITLQEIFSMTFEKIDLGFSKQLPNPSCPVGVNINWNLGVLYGDISNKVSDELGKVTLADFAGKF